MSEESVARRAIPLLDLTSLEDSDDEAKIARLCRRAETPVGTVAAVCLYPRFVTLARRLLPPGVRVATVANFPHGTGGRAEIAAAIRDAIADGADEIDVVFPYASFLAGDRTRPRDLVAAAREAAGGATLKIILETGRLGAPERIAEAAAIAIEGGADFLKTSTGKTQPAATQDAARVLLEIIAATPRKLGFKAAGGIRTLVDAATYLALADAIIGPEWAAPDNFRIGASALLDDLLAHLGASTASPAAESRY